MNYKKPAFWLVVLSVVICAAAAVCFLTNPPKNAVSFDDVRIIRADASDMRSSEPTSYKLNDAELGELKDRLRDLEIGRKNNYYGGFMPVYSLSIKAQGMEQFMIASYNSNGTHVGLMYQGEYYRIENDDFSVYLSNICAGGSRTEAAGNGNKDRLTLDDVTALSQKGEALSWADFERFYYVETGSGLYIRVYEIDSLFSLWIGGAGIDIEPMYISLRTGTEPEYAVDIRWEDVKDFIGRHRNLRVYRSVSDNSDDSEFFKRAEVVLYDDGTFTFTFSPVSSYLGYGTYETDDERLILNTDDGQYTYVFDMTDDTLVFNAAASAYQLWQYGITDGSVLKMY